MEMETLLNLADKPGRYLTCALIITANWEADSGNVWTVPPGIGNGSGHTLWQASCQHARECLLQCQNTGLWCQMAITTAVDVSQLVGSPGRGDRK